jgi:hypothetical protein
VTGLTVFAITLASFLGLARRKQFLSANADFAFSRHGKTMKTKA